MATDHGARTVDLLSQLLTEILQKTEPADAQAVAQSFLGLTPASGSVSGSGNTTLITPTGGKSLRVFYASYNPALAVEAAFRFGASGTLWLRNSVVASSVIAKDFGAFRYIQGAADEALILNLSLAVTTIWNTFYIEV